MSPYRVNRCIHFYNIGKVLYFCINFGGVFFNYPEMDLTGTQVALNWYYPELGLR